MDVGFTPVSDAPLPSTLKRPLENPTVTSAPRKKVSFAGETPTATETSSEAPPSTATNTKTARMAAPPSTWPTSTCNAEQLGATSVLFHKERSSSAPRPKKDVTRRLRKPTAARKVRS